MSFDKTCSEDLADLELSEDENIFLNKRANATLTRLSVFLKYLSPCDLPQFNSSTDAEIAKLILLSPRLEHIYIFWTQECGMTDG